MEDRAALAYVVLALAVVAAACTSGAPASRGGPRTAVPEARDTPRHDRTGRGSVAPRSAAASAPTIAAAASMEEPSPDIGAPRPLSVGGAVSLSADARVVLESVELGSDDPAGCGASYRLRFERGQEDSHVTARIGARGESLAIEWQLAETRVRDDGEMELMIRAHPRPR